MAFTGFPYAGVHFFQELHEYNNREWWASHQDVFLESVRQPFEDLLKLLRPEFGRTVIFGPKRRGDEELTKNSPYKEHQSALAASLGGNAWYLHLDGNGLTAGGGSYRSTDDQIQRFRNAVLDDFSGFELQMIIATCQRQGFKVSGHVLEQVSLANSDHPRAYLLSHTTLHVHYHFGTPTWLSTPHAADKVRQAWNAARPLVEWLDRHVGRALPLDSEAT